MVDNGDGTYTYSFTSTKSGKITVLVYLENNTTPVYALLWNNINLFGDVDKTWMYSNFNLVWASGFLTTSQLANTSGRFTTYITVPKDDTYTIYLFHDNGGKVYVDGILKLSNWANSISEDNFSITMNKNNKYKFVIEFYNSGGPAQLILSWSYPSQSKITIPDSAFSFTSYISSTPLTIFVSPSWGNGIRNSNEECDDGNTVSGDGWSNTWIIENNWTCTYGGLTSKDIWKWSNTTQPTKTNTTQPTNTNTNNNSNNTNSNNETVKSTESTHYALTYTILILILLSSFANLVGWILSSGSIQSIFSLINKVQLILLLPMIPQSMSNSVVNFIASLNFSLLNFGFLLNSNSSGVGSISNGSYSQSNSYLAKINLVSGSGLININGTILIFIILVLSNILILVTFLALKRRFSNKWYVKALK